jgi:hypothetical protein
MCFFILSTAFSEIYLFLILERLQRDTITNVHRYSCKVPVILVRVQSNLNFLDIFSNNPEISNFMKIRPVGARMFHADRRTDMTQPIVVFSNFLDASKTPYCRTQAHKTIISLPSILTRHPRVPLESQLHNSMFSLHYDSKIIHSFNWTPAKILENTGNVVGTATCYGLGGQGIESRWGAKFPAPGQTGPGPHTASSTMGTGSLARR